MTIFLKTCYKLNLELDFPPTNRQSVKTDPSMLKKKLLDNPTTPVITELKIFHK